jgi:orotidine 5'-phosphate decarboxylase subfamily 2
VFISTESVLGVLPDNLARSRQEDNNIGGMSNSESFFSKLESRIAEIGSHLCVGLDPHIKELFPNGDGDSKSEQERCDAAYDFCKRIIDATAPHAAAYKPNAAFFEALGPNIGVTTLRKVIAAIPSSIPTLLDVKRGDIGSTAQAYAEACYDDPNGVNADGVTLSPLMGWDSVAPFISGKYSNKGAFVLCKTSNPGSNDLLALSLSQGQTLFEKIAGLAQIWSDKAISESQMDVNGEPPRLGLVVGATDPDALAKARKACGPNMWILAPGVGAQGGDLDAACRAGLNSKGTGMLIPVSRGISRAADPAAKAKELKDGINDARKAVIDSNTSKKRTHPDTCLNADQEVAPYQKEFLEFSLDQGVLKFGSFVLKSGRTSPYFFNAGLFASGAALFKLGKAYAASIMSSKELIDNDGKVVFDVIFGPAYKGISLGAVVCAALYSDYGVDVGFAYDRKEAKDHGEGGKLVGASMENKRILIVDDVITAGTAIRESHQMLIKIGAKPVGVSIALDRSEKRSLDDPISSIQAVARDLEIPVVSIVSLPQLQGFLRVSPDYGDDLLEQVTTYRSQYGV